jgi:signal peptidase
MNARKTIKISLIVGIVITIAVFMLFYRPVSLRGDTRYEPVYTGSMEPAIPVGSVVVIKPVDPESLREGDIICFELSGPTTTITHRIINITEEGFITKGDANEDPDQWIVRRENIVGKALFTIPFMGYLVHFVRTPMGFILLIVIPASLIIIMEIRNIVKELGKQKTVEPPEARREKAT